MRKKIYPEEKCEIVRRVETGEFSQPHAAELMGVHAAGLQAWIRIYDSEGTASCPGAMSVSLQNNMAQARSIWSLSVSCPAFPVGVSIAGCFLFCRKCRSKA